MLIQIGIKPSKSFSVNIHLFESFVNSDRYKALGIILYLYHMFESFVNSDRYKAGNPAFCHCRLFESFVNSDRYKA